MQFLAKNIFTTPTWLINRDISAKTGTDPLSLIGGRMESSLNSLLSSPRMAKLISAEAMLGKDTYTLTEFMGDLQKTVWSEVYERKAINVYRRNLQKAYVERLGGIINPAAGGSGGSFGGITISFGPTLDAKKTDIVSVAKGTLRSLKADISAAIPAAPDKLTRYHLQDVMDRIGKILDPK
jgi:hypothetical protein